MFCPLRLRFTRLLRSVFLMRSPPQEEGNNACFAIFFRLVNTPMKRCLFCRLLLLFSVTAWSQDIDHEAFTVEGTVSAWFLHPAGDVISNGNLIDLRTDLGVSSRHTSPFIRAILKPSRKNRIVFETIPYRME